MRIRCREWCTWSWTCLKKPHNRAQMLLDQLNLSTPDETEEFPESLISAAKLDTGVASPLVQPIWRPVSNARMGFAHKVRCLNCA